MTFFFFPFFCLFRSFTTGPTSAHSYQQRRSRGRSGSNVISWCQWGNNTTQGEGGRGHFPGAQVCVGWPCPLTPSYLPSRGTLKKGKTSKDVAVSHALLFDPPTHPPPFRNRPSRRGLLAVPVIPAVFSQETVISFFFFFGNEWCSRAGMPVFPLSHGCLL